MSEGKSLDSDDLMMWRLPLKALNLHSIKQPSQFQVAVYMAKRDFVDHCDFVDPVGEFQLNLEILLKISFTMIGD